MATRVALELKLVTFAICPPRNGCTTPMKEERRRRQRRDLEYPTQTNGSTTNQWVHHKPMGPPQTDRSTTNQWVHHRHQFSTKFSPTQRSTPLVCSKTCQLMELKETKGWGKNPHCLRHFYETLLPENLERSSHWSAGL